MRIKISFFKKHIKCSKENVAYNKTIKKKIVTKLLLVLQHFQSLHQDYFFLLF